MAYASAANMITRYDVRRLGELVRDDGTKASSVELLTDDVLSAMLDDASDMIDSALVAGQRYTEDELETLYASGTDNKVLIRLCCDLAYGLLVSRRGYSTAEVEQLAPRYAEANNTLTLLREGTRILEIEGKSEATRPHRVVLSSNVSLVSSASRLFGTLSEGTGV